MSYAQTILLLISTALAAVSLLLACFVGDKFWIGCSLISIILMLHLIRTRGVLAAPSPHKETEE